MQIGLSFDFAKSSDKGRYVRGWASVVEMDGKPVTDTDGDVIGIETLRKAAHNFIMDMRVAKAMHNGGQIGDVVESVIVDDDFAEAIGMTDTKRGLWIGMIIEDQAIRKRINSGDLKAFSIGGRGRKVVLED